MAGRYEPLYRITADDRGGIVVVSAYSWTCTTMVAVGARLMLGYLHKVHRSWEDLVFMLASALTITSSICTHVAVNAGLGKHITTLSEDQLMKYFKSMYTAQLLGITGMACAKLSTVYLLLRVLPETPRSYPLVHTIIWLWLIFSLFAIGFHCGLPHPWVFLPGQCPSRGYLQYVVISTDMVTNILLALWIIPIIWPTSLPKNARISVVVLFGLRIIVPFVSIGQLWALSNILHDHDQTWASFYRVIFDHPVQNLSVILATLPRINRFLSGVNDGIGMAAITNSEIAKNRENSNHTLRPERYLSTSSHQPELSSSHRPNSRHASILD